MKKEYFQLHIAVFLAGFTGILGKLITLNEGLLVWYRLLITSVSMWILFPFFKKIQRINKQEFLKLFGIGCIAALHWLSFYGSIKYSNVSVALVCFSSVGFFTSLLEPLILRVRIKFTEVVLGLLVIVGIYIIFHFDPQFKTGIVLGVLSALLLAIMVIFTSQIVKKINAETFLTYQQTGGLIFITLLLPFYLYLFPEQNFIPGNYDWMWLFVLSWVCSVWAFQLSTNALKKLSAFTVNLTYNLEPVYGILLAFLVFGENKNFGWPFFVGIALITTSIAIHFLMINRQRKMKV